MRHRAAPLPDRRLRAEEGGRLTSLLVLILVGSLVAFAIHELARPRPANTLDAVRPVSHLPPLSADEARITVPVPGRAPTWPGAIAPEVPAAQPPAPPPLPERRSSLGARGRLQERAPRSIVLGDGRIVARSRAAGPLRCSFCHDGLDDAPARCPGCDTAVHAECVDELRRCPTAGCDQRRRAA